MSHRISPASPAFLVPALALAMAMAMAMQRTAADEPLFPKDIDVKVPPISSETSVRYDCDIMYVRALRTGDEQHTDQTFTANTGAYPASALQSCVMDDSVKVRPVNHSPAPEKQTRGKATASEGRPARFPHRIWAACDFEAQTPDYAWFGTAETKDIPAYPGNRTSLLAGSGGQRSALKGGMNPVPGPMMGRENKLYLRYFLHGATEGTFQHFSLTTEDNNHIQVSGLTNDKWSELTLNFSRDAVRNDGTPGVPFKEGERMDDFQLYTGAPAARNCRLLLDDVIFFSDDPALPPEKEPFPNRVIFLAAFDTGTDAAPRKKYWPGEYPILTEKTGAPAGSYWGVARAIPRKDAKGKWLRLPIDPPKPAGALTKVRFRAHVSKAAPLTVQIFDATDQDNRHVRTAALPAGEWTTQYADLTAGKRNDGSNTPFAAGHLVDDLFFFLDDTDAELHLDEVVLYDAGR